MLISKPTKAHVLVGCLVYAFLYIPLILLIVFAFNRSRIGMHWLGFSLEWYRTLWDDTELIDATINSLYIAVIASLVSIVLGTLSGIALSKYKLSYLKCLIWSPLAAPELLIGVSLLLFYLLINFSLGLYSILFAHIAFCTSFVSIAVNITMLSIDPNILDAARDLGANLTKVFFTILLPLLLPGIVAGGLMAFTLSIDDFVITFFTAGSGMNTLPLVIYAMLKTGVTPEINAASTLIIVATLVLLGISFRLSKTIFRSF